MKLIKITVNFAFMDCEKATLESVRARLYDYAADGLNAEVTFTSDSSERDVEIEDPDFDSDSAVDVWQEKAREELETMPEEVSRG